MVVAKGHTGTEINGSWLALFVGVGLMLLVIGVGGTVVALDEQ